MNERINDENRLIDFLRNELPPMERREVQERLDRDEAFSRLHDDIANTLAALQLSTDIDPPEYLVDITLARVRQVRRTDTLLAKEEARGRVIWPTFSLRELSAVAAAIVLMAAVFVPSIRQARRKAVIRQCSSQAAQIGAAMQTYANANDDYLPAVDGQRRRWLAVGDQPAFSNSTALFKLIRFGREYASPVIFRCPAREKGTFVVKAGMSDFPDDRYISYSYQHAWGPRPLSLSDPVRAAVAERMAILADSTPIFVRGRFRPERIRSALSDNHGRTGQNVLYLDMRVDWANCPTVGVRGDNIFLVKGVVDYRGDEQPAEPTDTFLLPTFSSCR